MRKTPWEIAEGWYQVDEIVHYLLRQKRGSDVVEMGERIPEDIYSREFAEWLTHQYRLAMAKGIQLARDDEEF